MRDEAVINVSIWQSPDLKRPTSFSFPDETGRIGFAYLLSELGAPEPLNGRLTIRHLEVGMPVEGAFNFTSERGGQFKGEFIAEWGELIAMCG
jgi:hypothetical protein